MLPLFVMFGFTGKSAVAAIVISFAAGVGFDRLIRR